MAAERKFRHVPVGPATGIGMNEASVAREVNSNR
jgi:hypothetical protein